jgi:hypothetical protein
MVAKHYTTAGPVGLEHAIDDKEKTKASKKKNYVLSSDHYVMIIRRPPVIHGLAVPVRCRPAGPLWVVGLLLVASSAAMRLL